MAQSSITDVLILAFSCVLIFVNSAETADPDFRNGRPLHWDQVPGDLDNFKKQDGHSIIDPWRYLERMGIYKILLTSSDKYFGILGLDSTENLLWGLTLQHGWQFKTGRLADPSKTTNCGYASGDPFCISAYSWWACMNYYLATLPFLAAADAGLFEKWQDQTKILPPDQFSDEFCYSIASCQSSYPIAMKKWKFFFEYLKSTKPVSDVSSAVDKLLQYMWDAHEESIIYALLKFKSRLRFFSPPEGKFGQDWAAAVQFIGPTHFQTNFENTSTFQAYLPPRMLTVNDEGANFTAEQKKSLQMLSFLNNMNKLTGGYLLQLWKQTMCSPEGRIAGREIFQNMITGAGLSVVELLHILKALVSNYQCITDTLE